jgi:UDP-N-acetylglucosamine transferase subunit ALG13
MIFVCVSTGHFDPLIQECDRLRGKFDFFGQIGSGTHVPGFRHVRTLPPAELEKHMAEAELVVSHAGTGMLSMLYRLRKRAIVIPKQIRYGEANDSQVELAEKWGQLGMAVLLMDVHGLEEAIRRCRSVEPRFPSFPSLGRYISEELWTKKRSFTHSSAPSKAG